MTAKSSPVPLSMCLRNMTRACPFAKDVFINQERKLGLKTIRYRPSLNHKRCRPGSADVAFRTRWHLMRNQSFWVPGSMVARLKLKGIDGRAPPGVEPALNLTQHGKLTRSRHIFERKLRLKPSGRGHACLGVTNRRPQSSRGYRTEAGLPCYRTPLAKIRAKDARSALTCGGEFTRQIAPLRPKALDDPNPEKRLSDGPGPSSWKGAPERVRALPRSTLSHHAGAVYESGCLGMQPQSGGKFRPRLNMGETDNNKYREVKMKRTLKRESKSA
ncbi:hypothetical protein Bca4012_102561 [Brassica carinata]